MCGKIYVLFRIPSTSTVPACRGNKSTKCPCCRRLKKGPDAFSWRGAGRIHYSGFSCRREGLAGRVSNRKAIRIIWIRHHHSRLWTPRWHYILMAARIKHPDSVRKSSLSACHLHASHGDYYSMPASKPARHKFVWCRYKEISDEIIAPTC